MEKSIYVHYGNDTFDPGQVRYAKFNKRNGGNGCYRKPGGLWASPVDAWISWKEWCEGEDFHTDLLDSFFTFTLKDGAKVLDICKLEDIEGYIKVIDEGKYGTHYYLDLDKIYREFDAMEIHHEGHYNELHDSDIFYAWDVDSICVWNPDMVEVIRGRSNNV